jgi:hypothetical protein
LGESIYVTAKAQRTRSTAAKPNRVFLIQSGDDDWIKIRCPKGKLGINHKIFCLEEAEMFGFVGISPVSGTFGPTKPRE